MSNKMRKFADDSPFEQPQNPLVEADRMIYGGEPNLPESGRVVAKLIDVFSVRPDIQQPRRILPMAVREDWNGDPQEVPILLARWLDRVNHVIGMELPIQQVLRGEWENTLNDKQKNEPVVWSFFDIVGLAITIVQTGQRDPVEYAEGVLIDGERRWWATHMLNAWAGKVDGRNFGKILATEKQKPDVWAQATRNGARTELNAIEMARQIALLIMAMYEGDAGVAFNSFKQLVLPGGVDRGFYAQVANGEVYRIKRGMTEKVMAATGLKSPERVRNYRALLNIPDGLWVKADEQNWSDWQIRDYWEGIKAGNPDITKLHTVEDSTVSGGSAGTVEGNDIPKTERVRGVSGLYVDQPVQKKASPPAPLPRERGESQRAAVQPDYDEDFDDFDEDDGVEWVDEPGYAPIADWPEQEPVMRSLESSTAILATWDAQGHRVRAVLEMLRSVTDDKNARVKITELMTLSQKDIVDHLEPTRGGWWDTYIQEVRAVLNPVLQTNVMRALDDYIMHMKQEGDFLRDKYQRQ